jgi:GDPmannose 4,6-dehydratase
MLQAEKPDSYVLSTNKTTKIRVFVEKAFEVIGRSIRWEGSGDSEKGYDTKSGELLVAVNPEFYRPAEVDLLIGDSHKAFAELGWKPTVDMAQLAEIMVKSDIEMLK